MEYEAQISELENRLSDFSTQKEDIDDVLERHVTKSGQLDTLYMKGTAEEQQN